MSADYWAALRAAKWVRISAVLTAGPKETQKVACSALWTAVQKAGPWVAPMAGMRAVRMEKQMAVRWAA